MMMYCLGSENNVYIFNHYINKIIVSTSSSKDKFERFVDTIDKSSEKSGLFRFFEWQPHQI